MLKNVDRFERWGGNTYIRNIFSEKWKLVFCLNREIKHKRYCSIITRTFQRTGQKNSD